MEIKVGLNWRQAAEICILGLEQGTEKGKQLSRDEIRRMGNLLDRLIRGGADDVDTNNQEGMV